MLVCVISLRLKVLLSSVLLIALWLALSFNYNFHKSVSYADPISQPLAKIKLNLNNRPKNAINRLQRDDIKSVDGGDQSGEFDLRFNNSFGGGRGSDVIDRRSKMNYRDFKISHFPDGNKNLVEVTHNTVNGAHNSNRDSGDERDNEEIKQADNSQNQPIIKNENAPQMFPYNYEYVKENDDKFLYFVRLYRTLPLAQRLFLATSPERRCHNSVYYSESAEFGVFELNQEEFYADFTFELSEALIHSWSFITERCEPNKLMADTMANCLKDSDVNKVNYDSESNNALKLKLLPESSPGRRRPRLPPQMANRFAELMSGNIPIEILENEQLLVYYMQVPFMNMFYNVDP